MHFFFVKFLNVTILKIETGGRGCSTTGYLGHLKKLNYYFKSCKFSKKRTGEFKRLKVVNF